ncbi:thioesterase domain-containing protein [Fluoribacter dumoffii]|uniref:Thioesterase domain-containing protein n=1 Tax=Fluoribacter dumoffii TaxID=463 RepID=A0A377GAL3_9GAMM|nr:thioesterase domain-containing protein [Fluoribacter dumoffii]KTC88650.1 hypothetical protein Ldum_2908 [Fluoribacter dumoffii NY 23]MCW8386058.1 thioesterase domain-containing protein [Fluoribacter dumoffii]MCW8419110.1 thioesterase domain-containing protein [Fluoribacter dumoffii]MCW8453046.1 thioesterase domain-containing protein [Fluoribacter dumoffii]MCW8459736.1 thioesterase domain-containing protein [Fluoribacter dumoffii]
MNFVQIRKSGFFNSFLFLLLAMSLAGCVDLSGGRASEKRPIPKTAQSLIHEPASHNKAKSEKSVKVSTSQTYHGEVHTMLGGLGLFSTGMRTLSGSVVEEFNVPAPSNMWYNAGDVTRSIVSYYRKHQMHRPIILVGHSLGANEQIKVARNLEKAGIPVDLLVTVDAVSQTIVPPNVKHAMNFYKPGFVPMFSGLKLRAVNPEQTRIDNINVGALKGVQVNHFTIDKDPVVQAMIMEEVKKVLSNANRANG